MNEIIHSTPDWMSDIRRIYLQGADDKLAALDHAIAGLEANPDSQSSERNLRRLLHNLVGSGGSYGFPEVSDTARCMSECLRRQREKHLPVDRQLLADLRGQLAHLRRAFASASL